MQWSVSLAAAMSKGRPRRGWFLHRSACRSLILTDTRSRGQRVRTDLRFAKSNPPAEAAGVAEFIHLVFTILGFIAQAAAVERREKPRHPSHQEEMLPGSDCPWLGERVGASTVVGALVIFKPGCCPNR
jgi:hypothetical protein